MGDADFPGSFFARSRLWLHSFGEYDYFERRCNLTQQWTIGQDETVILNLNGNDLSVQQAILVEGELTVEDSTASTGPEVKSDYSVDYTSGTIKNSGTTVLVQNGGSLIVNSGTIQSSSNIAVAVYGSTTMENWDTPVYSQATIAGGYLLSREFGAAVYGNGQSWT